jgi:trimeric autotransporter adhesin
MNKIFKVVWSKTKECYVVVSEVAKNNGGKKKALASVLAGLAMVAAAGRCKVCIQILSKKWNQS